MLISRRFFSSVYARVPASHGRFTDRTIADALAVSTATVANWRSGRSRVPLSAVTLLCEYAKMPAKVWMLALASQWETDPATLAILADAIAELPPVDVLDAPPDVYGGQLMRDGVMIVGTHAEPVYRMREDWEMAAIEAAEAECRDALNAWKRPLPGEDMPAIAARYARMRPAMLKAPHPPTQWPSWSPGQDRALWRAELARCVARYAESVRGYVDGIG